MPWQKAKFTTKSNRVKGLSFHPHRPWILSSLHNGQIQLWDYSMEILIYTFEEHDGPVRSVDFHLSQPLFVSGGDDYKIKVWNYSLRRCLFSLNGHLDYIRTVQFHPEYPWILSSSDDQTIRIWNWQNRTCLSVLTGHNHYVMCAAFHPTEDLVLSASLDQTVRIWDISGLSKKHVTIAGVPLGKEPQNSAADGMFGSSEVEVKHVLEGHTRGVNWAAFHRTMPLVVSGADDREVKLWRMNETKAWEVDTMRGHTNNVSCVLFHPKLEVIISNSEDKSIRVWDIAKQQTPKVWRRDNDRFWILTCHPRLNLLAAGHDGGFFVFKLDKERPAYSGGDGKVIFYKNKSVFEHDIRSGRENSVVAIRTNNFDIQRSSPPRELHVNPHNVGGNVKQQQVLLFWEDNVSNYELCTYSTSGNRDFQTRKGSGKAVAFVSRKRFAVLTNDNKIHMKNMENVSKKTLPVGSGVQKIYAAGIDKLLLRTNDKMILYNVNTKKELGSCTIEFRHPVKYVSWSEGHNFLALMTKFNITLTDRHLNIVATIPETSKIKSGAWDGSSVFIYSTSNHLKYALATGDHGIIKTLNDPIYLSQVKGKTVTAIDRELQVKTFSMDTTEFMFKLALIKGDKNGIMKIIERSRLVGESIIGYLQKKGYPQIALHFVEDMKTKFALALECGELEVAYECAEQLKDPDSWNKLGQVALEQGDFEKYKNALGQTRSLEKLTFHFLLSGNRPKMEQLLSIGKKLKSPLSTFHNSLLLGNVEERVNVLVEAGQLGLAYILAKNHGLSDSLLTCAEKLTPEQIEKLDAQCGNANLIFPPNAIVPADGWGDWPTLKLAKNNHWDRLAEVNKLAAMNLVGEDSDQEDNVNRSETPSIDEDDVSVDNMFFDEDDNEDDKDDDEEFDFDIGDEEEQGSEEWDNIDEDDIVVVPREKEDFRSRWKKIGTVSSSICSGDFNSGITTLQQRHRIANFQPIKNNFIFSFQGSGAEIPGIPGSGSLQVPILQVLNDDEENERPPCVPYTTKSISAIFRSVSSLDIWKELDEAEKGFRECLRASLFVNITNAKQKNTIRDIQERVSTYISAIRVAKAAEQKKGTVEEICLRLHLTRYKLAPKHKAKPLLNVIQLTQKKKYFRTCANLCREYFNLIETKKSKLKKGFLGLAKKIKKMLAKCDEINKDAEPALEYDVDLPKNEICICPLTWKVIQRQGGVSQPSSFDADDFAPSCKGYISPTCDLCKIGEVGIQDNAMASNW